MVLKLSTTSQQVTEQSTSSEMAKQKKKFALLIGHEGEPGVGKTEIVDGFFF